MEPDIRDSVVEFIDHWHARTGYSKQWFCQRIGIHAQRLADWRQRFGVPNAHNGGMPRNFWVSEEEQQRVIDFYLRHSEEGYRRCTYMMIDNDVAYVSPATSWRILKQAGVMRQPAGRKTGKGNGFAQPSKPHEHWHTDISCVRVGSPFYFLISVLDGYSRSIINWDLCDSMTSKDVSIVLQGAVENVPEGTAARVISDRGSQFTGSEFRRFLGFHGLTHATTSPYYPQSNGKVERWFAAVKGEGLQGKALADIEHAKEVIRKYVHYYNEQRLHSALGYVTPADRLAGRDGRIKQDRDRKLAEARRRRRNRDFSFPPCSSSSDAGADVKAVAV